MKILLALLGVLLVYLIVYIGVLIRNGIREDRSVTEADQYVRTISIVGVGTVPKRYDASEATLNFTVLGDTVGDVLLRADELLDRVTARLEAAGVAAQDIRMVPFGAYPSEPSSGDEEAVSAGFQMDVDIIVFLRDPMLSDEIIALSKEEEVQYFGGFVPRPSHPRGDLERARTEALRNARAQVKELSSLLGTSFVRVYTYAEENSEDSPELFDTSFEKVSLRVYITFEVL